MSKKVSELKVAPIVTEPNLTPMRKELDTFPLVGVIQSDLEFEDKRERYKVARAIEKKIATAKASILDPIKESIKATNKLFKPLEDSIDTIIEEYTFELSRYANSKEIARMEAIAKAENDKRIKNIETMQARKEAAGHRLEGTMRVTKLVIETPGKVPLKYWVIDEKAVKAALQDGIVIPGAKLVEELVVTSR